MERQFSPPKFSSLGLMRFWVEFVKKRASNNQNIIKKLSELFSTCSFGKTKIYLIIENKKIQTSYSIKLTDDIQDKLKIIVPSENIKIKP